MLCVLSLGRRWGSNVKLYLCAEGLLSIYLPLCFSCVFWITELSFTSHNLSTVLDSMDDSWWWDFGFRLNIPHSELEKIKSEYSNDKECKQAAIDYLISSHPAPSWRLVARALYQMVSHSSGGDSSHTALTTLQQLFPTGT